VVEGISVVGLDVGLTVGLTLGVLLGEVKLGEIEGTFDGSAVGPLLG